MSRMPISMEEDRKLGRLFMGACAAFALGGYVVYSTLSNANASYEPNAVPLGNITAVDRNGDGMAVTDVKGRGANKVLHYLLQYDETGTPVIIPQDYAQEIDITRTYEEQRRF